MPRPNNFPISTTPNAALYAPIADPRLIVPDFGTLGLQRAVYRNVHDYGARGLATDDSAALNLAIADLPATGGTVHHPEGVYGLAARSLALASNLVLQGAGRDATTLRVLSGASVPVLATVAAPISNLTIRDMTFDGGNLACLLWLLVPGCTDITIERCRFINSAPLAGAFVGWPVAIGATGGANRSARITLRDCDFGTINPLFESCILIRCQDFDVSGNHFHDTTGAAQGTGLALYYDNYGGTVAHNRFGVNVYDGYIQESANIAWVGNESTRSSAGFGMQIYNSQHVVLAGSTWCTVPGSGAGLGSVGIQIHDMGGQYINGRLPHIYSVSQDIKIVDCIVDGYQVPILLGHTGGNAQNLGQSQFADVKISGCSFPNVPSGIPVQIGARTAQNIRRIIVERCETNGTYANGYGGFNVVGNIAGAVSTALNQSGVTVRTAPPLPSVTVSANASAHIASGTYPYAASYTAGRGNETMVCVSGTFTVADGQQAVFTHPTTYAAASGWRLYIGTAGGDASTLTLQGSTLGTTSDVTLTTTPTTTGQTPQLQSTFPQQVIVSSTTNISPGHWLHIGGANAEDFYVISVDDSTHLTCVFGINALADHTAGTEAITMATGANGITNNGLTDVVIRDCTPAGGGSGTYGVQIDGVVATSKVRLIRNDLSAGTAGAVSLQNSGAYTIARDNLGYNPLGALTPPAIPAAGSPSAAVVNPFGVDCMVNIVGGTVTGVQVSNGTGASYGQQASVTPCTVFVPANSSIRYIGTVAPTNWFWTGV